MQDRLDWIDTAKGLGIILVVLGHAGRGLSAAGLPDTSGFLVHMDQTIYAFHMPLFFLLSGITFGMRPPANIQPVLIKRSWRLFYVLLIWTYAFLAMRALAGSSANAGGSWYGLMQAPLPPFGHFWYLWALLINAAVFALLRLAMPPALRDAKFWIGAIVLSVCMNMVIRLPQELLPWFSQALQYSLVFTVGGLIGASSLLRLTPSMLIALIGCILFIAGVWISVTMPLPINQVTSGLILSLFLMLPLIALTNRFSGSKTVAVLAYLGLISLAIYVMHTMFSAAMRIVLMKAGYTDLALHLGLSVAVGLCGPLLVYLAAKRFNLLRVMGLG